MGRGQTIFPRNDTFGTLECRPRSQAPPGNGLPCRLRLPFSSRGVRSLVALAKEKSRRSLQGSPFPGGAWERGSEGGADAPDLIFSAGTEVISSVSLNDLPPERHVRYAGVMSTALLPPPAPTSPPADPGTFRALRHRNYRLYFAGQVVSLTGSWVQTAALTWLAYTLTAGSSLPARVTAAQVVPTLILGAWGGSLADRLPRRSLIFLSQAALARPGDGPRGHGRVRPGVAGGAAGGVGADRRRQRHRHAGPASVRRRYGRPRRPHERRRPQLARLQRGPRRRPRTGDARPALGRPRRLLLPQRPDLRRRPLRPRRHAPPARGPAGRPRGPRRAASGTSPGIRGCSCSWPSPVRWPFSAGPCWRCSRRCPTSRSRRGRPATPRCSAPSASVPSPARWSSPRSAPRHAGRC